MKTKFAALLCTLACLPAFLPATGRAEVQLTALRIFGIGADGNRNTSYYNTVGGDIGFNVYLFTGSVEHPNFLNSGNTDDSLNPRFNLAPGTYHFGFAGDAKPSNALNLELCFNNEYPARISVVAHDGGTGNFTGRNTFTDGETTVTLTELRTFDKPADLVSPYEHAPNGTPDTGGWFTLVVTRKSQTYDAPVTLNDFKLSGDLSGEVAAFTLTANAKVDCSRGGQLVLLSGPVALTSLAQRQPWQLNVNGSQFIANFDRSGNYPIELHFNAQVRHSNDWNTVDFQVAPSALQPVILSGLAPDTEFQFAQAARPDRQGTNFVSYLPVDGSVSFAWRQGGSRIRGKIVLRRRNDFAGQCQSRFDAPDGLVQRQNHAGRNEPHRHPPARPG